MNKEDDRTLL